MIRLVEAKMRRKRERGRLVHFFGFSVIYVFSQKATISVWPLSLLLSLFTFRSHHLHDFSPSLLPSLPQVTALKFGHPASAFLATSSLDRTVKVYH